MQSDLCFDGESAHVPLLFTSASIAQDKACFLFNQIVLIIFLIFLRKHMLWYSLEAPRYGASNECTKHMFSWR